MIRDLRHLATLCVLLVASAALAVSSALGATTPSATPPNPAGAEQAINVKAPPYNAVGDGVADDTAAIQAAIAATPTGRALLLPSGTYKVTRTLTISTPGIAIRGTGWGTEIRMTTPNTTIFYAKGVSNLSLGEFSTYGEGTWSSAWTGIEGHHDRGIELLDCAGFLIDRVRTRNHGAVGIAIRGTSNGRIVKPQIEGTNRYSTPIPAASTEAASNFQMGIMLQYGDTADLFVWGHVVIDSPDISGVAQGILLVVGVSKRVPGAVEIISPYFHNITGQHGIYNNASHVTITSPVCRDVNLGCVKIQTNKRMTQVLEDVSVSNLEATNLAGNAVEITGLDDLGLGVRHVRVTGRATNTGRGISIAGQVRDVQAEIEAIGSTGHAAYIGDSGSFYPSEISLKIKAMNVKRNGVYVSSSSGKVAKIDIWPTLVDVGQEAPDTYSGVSVEGLTTDLALHNPSITDSTGKMRHGVSVSTAGTTWTIVGRAMISGAKRESMRGGKVREVPEKR